MTPHPACFVRPTVTMRPTSRRDLVAHVGRFDSGGIYVYPPRHLCLPTQVWSAAPTLAPRIKKLRDEYWNFYTRPFTNQVRAYTTGTSWDCVYAIWSWTNVPKVALFQQGFRSYLGAAATTVKLADGFWNEPIVVRQALFFREVVRQYLPAQILDGELIVGSNFSTALSRCLTRGNKARAITQRNAFSKNGTRSTMSASAIAAQCPVTSCLIIPRYYRLDGKGFRKKRKRFWIVGTTLRGRPRQGSHTGLPQRRNNATSRTPSSFARMRCDC